MPAVTRSAARAATGVPATAAADSKSTPDSSNSALQADSTSAHDRPSIPREWRPEKPCQLAPLFEPSQWSARSVLKYFFDYPGFFYPWNSIYFAVCCLSYHYTNPPLEACREFAPEWVVPLFARNLALLWVFAGGWHLVLYTLKGQGADQEGRGGMSRKYDKQWPGQHRKFMFGHQTYENVFMSCTSGVAVWTFYEALFLKAWATGAVPFYSDWFHNPAFVPEWMPGGSWSALLLVATPFWREFHFYWIHRFSHWQPLYKRVHYLHHKNVNPGPWSGLSMHPVEHLLYFAVVAPHMWLLGHPIHLLFNAQHTALTPAGGHHGFDGCPDAPGPLKHSGSYFHYLHHRYFECNYGEATIPLDKWFGSFRDGESAADRKISSTPGGSKEPPWVTALTCVVGVAIGVLPLGPLAAAAM